MKLLTIVFVLLLLGLAVGSPQAWVGSSMMIGGGSTTTPPLSSITCDYGSSYVGSVPAGAAASGFNTCAINFDFSSTANFTIAGNTYNWGTISTWLQCAGATNFIFVVNAGTCSQFRMITDPVTGDQILELSFVAGTDTTEPKLNTGAGSVVPLMPTGGYFEIVVRGDSASVNYSNSLPANSAFTLMDIYFQALNGTPIPWIEGDILEAFGGNTPYNASWREWNAACAPSNQCPVNTPSFTVAKVGGVGGYSGLSIYHNYADRETIDTSGNTAWCTYLDGTQLADQTNMPGCGPYVMKGGTNTLGAAVREQWVIFGPTAGVGGTTPPTRLVAYIKRITTWACASWQTTLCPAAQNLGRP